MNERQRATVLFDGECALCRKSAALLGRLDWLGRLNCQNARDLERLPACEPPLEPAQLLEEMHVVTADRRLVLHGFAALRWLAWRLPLLWPVAPFLLFPGIPALGQRTYLWLARRRYALVPCQDDVCQLPTSSDRTPHAHP